MNTVERAARLILPRLEAYKNTGNAATIHQINQYIGAVRGYLDLLDHGVDVAEDLERATKDAYDYLLHHIGL